jgi:hypothetical protein
MMGHPHDTKLALFAGGDLAALDRWLISRHVSGCSRCRDEVAGYRASSIEMLQSVTSLPKDLDWQRLAAEMQANIRVGLAAGACVGSVPEARDHIGWKAALAAASIAVLVATGWLLNTPRRGPAGVQSEIGIVLETSASSIEIKQNGSVFSMRHPSQNGLTVSMSGQGSVGARYLDTDTGQVTIHHVYAE